MIWLILGVAIWSGAHLCKRLTPGFRAGLTDKMGEASKGLFAGLFVVSIILMVIGYRAADATPLWDRSAALTGINNLLVLLGFYMFAASGAKTRITRFIRHPQLTGFALWAFAHLLVNGDVPSIILFGGLLVWALAEIVIISRATDWAPPPPPPMKKEVTAVVASLVLFGVIAGIHTWLGYSPFG